MTKASRATMLVASDTQARINLAVVALGTPMRLRDCLESLQSHETAHPFTLTVVVNPAGRLATDPDLKFADEITVLRPASNVGWAGGLHVARAATTAELFVWVQEDMVVADGWLDALVRAADEHPEISAFGSIAVDAEGRPNAVSAGIAAPHNEVRLWNATDTTVADTPVTVTVADWVTSKGMLTRTSAWDAIAGTDPRLFPLNHVDKDYCTHLRAHGHLVALVPDARLRHLGSQSAPSAFRVFLANWQESWFNARWSDAVRRMSGNSGAPTEHACADWLPQGSGAQNIVEHVSRVCGEEASTMLVAYARWAAGEQAQAVSAARQEFLTTKSWRITAPLRAARGAPNKIAARLRGDL